MTTFPTVSLLAYFGYEPLDTAAVGTELAARLYSAEWKYGQFDEGHGYEGLAATVYLDNADGAFNADNPTSPYYLDIKPAVRMQLLLDGEPHFTGFVKDWPFTARGGRDTPAGQIKIDLGDALSVLGLARLPLALYRDSFDRADQAGLGVADLGGAWELPTGEAGFSINGNQAVVDMNLAGATTPTTVYDAFARPATTPLGAANSGHVWTIHAGGFAWATEADYATFAPGGGTAPKGVRGHHDAAFDLATVETFTADVAIEPRLDQTHATWRADLIFRYSNSSNFWYVEIDWGGFFYPLAAPPILNPATTTQARLVKRVAGVDTTMATFVTATSIADAYPISKIETDGNDIRVYRGDGGYWWAGGYNGFTLVASVSDSFNATATRHGIGYRYAATHILGGPFRQLNIRDLSTDLETAVAAARLDTSETLGYLRALIVDPQPVGPSGSAAGPALLFRYLDSSNYLGVRRIAAGNYTLEIFDVTLGVYTALATVEMHDGPPTTFPGAELGGDVWALILHEVEGEFTVDLLLNYWAVEAGNPTLVHAQQTVTIPDLHNTATKHGLGYIQNPYLVATFPPQAARFDDFYFWREMPAEFTHERVGRLLDAANYPAAWRQLAEGRYKVGEQSNGIHPWLDFGLSMGLFQELADAEFGRFYLDHRGYAIFETNETRATSPASVTIQGSFGAAWDGKIGLLDWTFDSGERHIRTEVVVDGIAASRRVDVAAERAYGPRPGTWDTAIEGDMDWPENVAYYRRLADLFLARYARPVKRLTSITVDYWSDDAAAQVLERRIGDRIHVDVPPAQSGGSVSFDCLIEGVAGRLALDPGGVSLRATWALTPSSYAAYFILDDATLGVLDTGVLA